MTGNKTAMRALVSKFNNGLGVLTRAIRQKENK